MDRIKTWALPGAILITGVLVAAALLLGNRYATLQVANVLWVTDRLTGHVTYCAYPVTENTGPTTCARVNPPESWADLGRPLTDAEVDLKRDLSAWGKPPSKATPSEDKWVPVESRPLTPEEKAKLDASADPKADPFAGLGTKK